MEYRSKSRHPLCVGILFQDLQSNSKCGVVTIKEIDNIAFLKYKNKIFTQANISPTRL